MEEYRTDLETYLDLFKEGYIDFDIEKHARNTTVFTEYEDQLVKACFSVIDRMRANRTSIEFELYQEFEQDFNKLKEERDDLKQELALYQNFYEAVSVNMRFLMSNL